MNFQKLSTSLLMALLAIATISCQKKEVEKVPSMRSSQPTLSINTEAAQKSISIITNQDWFTDKEIVNPSEGETSDWLTVEPSTGSLSEYPQTIVLKIAANPYPNKEREVVVYFKTKDTYDTIRVYQTGERKTNGYETVSISSVRKMLPEDKTSTGKVSVTEHIKIAGLVISNSSIPTISIKNIYIQDGTDPGCGIIVYSSNEDTWSKCKFGDSVEVTLTGGKLQYYYQLVEFIPADDDQIVIVESGHTPKYAAITGKKFVDGDYESQLVSLYAQVKSDYLEKKMSEKPLVETQDKYSFIMFTKSEPSWAGTTVPQGAGNLYGLCGSYNAVFQIVPQTTENFQDLVHERFGE